MAAPTGLELTFLGHQTWHITDGLSTILLDPILAEAFGAGSLEFPIWPPRTVDVNRMPSPDAVILSHEHLDHFHLPSLAMLARTVPVYTGITTPSAVTDAITALGFTVHRLDHTTPLTVGDIEITLFPAGTRTLFWEQRVAQPLIRLAGTRGHDVFIGVDADVSDLFIEQLADGALQPPQLAVVSNNAQTVPYGALGADTNLLPGLDSLRRRKTGIEILNGLLIDYLQPLDGVREVALCGNGFTAPRSPHAPSCMPTTARSPRPPTPSSISSASMALAPATGSPSLSTAARSPPRAPAGLPSMLPPRPRPWPSSTPSSPSPGRWVPPDHSRAPRRRMGERPAPPGRGPSPDGKGVDRQQDGRACLRYP
ncbi:MBL fold metallo-hydrolase [Streptomyces inhibens]|uniref:MBL fold metallo-hydrolase n=1 Tax=Streptomyces inhibens TaxID=2293571 RepID=UPI00402A7478